MDVEPNPGPDTINISDLPTITKQLFNDAKRTRLKIIGYQSHLNNFIVHKTNNLTPKGLIPKCNPAITCDNPHFWQRWNYNLNNLAKAQLELLIEETNKNIIYLEALLVEQL